MEENIFKLLLKVMNLYILFPLLTPHFLPNAIFSIQEKWTIKLSFFHYAFSSFKNYWRHFFGIDSFIAKYGQME